MEVTVRVEEGVAIVTRGDGPPLGMAPRSRLVRIEPHVYAETPKARERVRLLEEAAKIADRLEVHAPLVSDGTYRGRLAIDLPRRAARAFGLRGHEPGDRVSNGRFKHAFFDDEPLILEAAQAGLGFVARRGAWIILERNSLVRLSRPHEDVRTPREDADPFAREVARVLRTIVEAERLRRNTRPEEAVGTMRARGRTKKPRGPIGRARLRRAIGWIDAAFPSGPNCFRRTLIELALDAGAAEETLVFGLDVGKTGHVAFKDSEDRRFDVFFEIAP